VPPNYEKIFLRFYIIIINTSIIQTCGILLVPSKGIFDTRSTHSIIASVICGTVLTV